GGAIFNLANLTASNLTLSDNQAIGGTDNQGGAFAGDGIGGGVINGFGGGPGGGGGPASQQTTSAQPGPRAPAPRGRRSGAGGGGIANVLGSTLTISNCTVDYNQAVGGQGVTGGNGLGGGLFTDGSSPFGVSSLTVTGSTITHNEATGGTGGAGGSAGQGVGG